MVTLCPLGHSQEIHGQRRPDQIHAGFGLGPITKQFHAFQLLHYTGHQDLRFQSEIFDAREFIPPLLDARGRHTQRLSDDRIANGNHSFDAGEDSKSERSPLLRRRWSRERKSGASEAHEIPQMPHLH